MATGVGETSGSDSYREDRTRHCHPCESDGDTVTAVGYCRDCQELLCQICYDVHRRPSKMRKHVLVGLQDINVPRQSTMETQTACQKHGDKKIEYHCPSHDFLGCHTCFFQHQKSCQDVKYIPDDAENITRSEEYREFNDRLASITAQCQGLVARVAECRKTAEESHAGAVDVFKAHKKKVLDTLDKLEKQFNDEADEFKQEESARLTKLREKLDNLHAQNEQMSSTIELLKKQRRNSDLYITMVQLQRQLLGLENDTREAARSTFERKISFKPDMGMLEKLKGRVGLGMLHVSGDTQGAQNPGQLEQKSKQRVLRLEHVGDIDVSCSSDTGACSITSSAHIARDKLVLADYGNEKVKLCDTSQSKVVSELVIPGAYPHGVCRISDNQAAVALGTNKLALVRVEPSLAVEREISVSGTSLGVGYCDGKLVVSYISPYKVEILDMQGAVLKVVERDQQGQKLFNYPLQLCVNPDNRLVYVSSYWNNELVCPRLDGTVLRRYRDIELWYPYQVIVDSGGTLYVCGRGSHNVHQVTGDCEKVRLLLTQADGLDCPASICYDERGGRMYIGQMENDCIKVYKAVCENM